MNILDILFPKYCVYCRKSGEFLCPNCFSRLSYEVHNICLVCTRPSYNSLTHPKCLTKNRIEGAFACLVFDQITKKLIHQFKYEPFLSSLAPFLADLMFDSLIQNEEFNKIKHVQGEVFLVPIPLSKKKYRSRGYNQSELISKELSKKFGWKTLNLLERVKDTKTQVGLTKVKRIENIYGSFEISKKLKTQNLKIKDKNILLIDDVVTTGATFNEATRLLKRAGVGKVWGVAFAKED